jgi:TPP-dependent pyruvate/acetoin dehydrogenase alpha subunit
MADNERAALDREIEKEIEEAVAFAEASDWEPVPDLGRFVYSERVVK